MSTGTISTSRIYGVVQSILLVAFAVGYFVDPSPAIVRARIAAPAGLVLCAAGVVLLLSALAAIRDVVQIAPEPRAGGRLVTRGVYSRFRHPIYTSIVLPVTGLFLRKPTTLTGVGAIGIILFLMNKVRFEEKLLLARYAEYREYRTRTWGILPWRLPWRVRSVDRAGVGQ